MIKIQKRGDIIVRWLIRQHHQLIMMILWVLLAYATYTLIYELVTAGFVVDTVISSAALAVSMYTYWRNYGVPPEVHVALEGKMIVPSTHETLAFIFHNKGSSGTYFSICEVECDSCSIFIRPSRYNPVEIGKMEIKRVTFNLANHDEDELTKEQFPIQIAVSYRYWQGVKQIIKKERFDIKVSEE